MVPSHVDSNFNFCVKNRSQVKFFPLSSAKNFFPLQKNTNKDRTETTIYYLGNDDSFSPERKVRSKFNLAICYFSKTERKSNPVSFARKAGF